MRFEILQADAARLPFRDLAFDLVMFSPPYCDARTYGIGAQRGPAPWVEWMLGVVAESLRVCRGPVIVNCGGVTRDRNYWPACEGLLWEWFKRGGESYRPCYWKRHGIPGSGGNDWFRADVEYVFCFKRPGPLVWADNTAMGHSPKFKPGGKPSHRTKTGDRVNQAPAGVKTQTRRKPNGERARDGEYIPPAKANPGNLIKVRVGGGLMGSGNVL